MTMTHTYYILYYASLWEVKYIEEQIFELASELSAILESDAAVSFPIYTYFRLNALECIQLSLYHIFIVKYQFYALYMFVVKCNVATLTSYTKRPYIYTIRILKNAAVERS